MSQFYRHSGTAPLFGLFRTFIVGSGAATFLAIVYAFAVHYIPFVYANLLMTIGMGFAIGYVVAWEAKNSKIRNGVLPALVGLGCGFAGLYVAWGADLIARAGIQEGHSIFVGLNPLVMAGYIRWFYENGQWGIGKGGAVVNGLPLAGIWLAEAATIVGLAAIVPWSEFKKHVFCEACDSWTRPEKNVLRLDDSGADALVQRVLAGDIAAIRDARRSPLESMQFLRVNLSCCESCAETNSLDLERVQIKLDKDKKPSEKTTSLVDRLLISGADVELVRSAATAPEPAA